VKTAALEVKQLSAGEGSEIQVGIVMPLALRLQKVSG